MSTIAVQCIGLQKRFGNTRAVRDFDLTLERGRLLALLGPSGCGKTTTLRLIAGFERPDAGTIEINGRQMSGPATEVAPEKRRVGMVFQEYALFPHLTVEQNVGYGVPRAERRQRAAEVLALVGLTGLEGRYPHQLSGGQQQRVALARALAPGPEVLLLDEPFSNLDADLRSQVRAEVKDILRTAGTTAIFVTHDQDEALFMGDLVAVMRDGQIEQVATPEALFHAPQTRFVAEFVGLADFLPATASERGFETEIGLAPAERGATTDGAIEVMVRPDDVVVRANDRGPARVVRSTFLGMHMLYQIALPSGRTVHALAGHTEAIAPGALVDVRLAGDHPLRAFPTNSSRPS